MRRRLLTRLIFASPSESSVPLFVAAWQIGRSDFARLVITIGLELGLIDEAQAVLSDGEVEYGYTAAGSQSVAREHAEQGACQGRLKMHPFAW